MPVMLMRLFSRDDFLYGRDPGGFACPMGAHVRRANPRDVIRPNKIHRYAPG